MANAAALARGEGAPPSRETGASWLSKLSFSWLDPTLALGYRRPLDFADVERLRNIDEARTLHATFAAERAARLARGDRRLWPCFWRVVWGPVMLAAACKLCGDALGYVGPLGLNYLVRYLADEGDALFFEEGFGWVAAAIIFAALALANVLLQQHHHLVIREGMHLRSLVISLVYDKALRLPAHSSFSSGTLTNMLSTDSGRLMDFLFFVHYLWAAPLQVAVCLALLVVFLGPAGLVGAAVMVLATPLQTRITRKQGDISRDVLRATDERVGGVSEMLQGVRILKFNAWEPFFLARAEAVRERELALVLRMSWLRALGVFLLQSLPIFVALSTFAVYALTESAPLTAAKAFTAISLFNILRGPLFVLPMTISYAVDALVALRRIAALLDAPELPHARPPPADTPPGAIALRVAGELRWDPAAPRPTFRGLELRVAPRELAVVCGAVGAGKSSLVAALLGELHAGPRRDAAASAPLDAAAEGGGGRAIELGELGGERDGGERQASVNGSLAYVAQTAWILNMSLRDNVLFGRAFDAARYEAVLEACALKPDIAMLPGGDATEIGERGINLSGGQKQRVALARACYADADVYVFDDALSALDSGTSQHVFERCISGLLAAKTRVLVTHQLRFAARANRVFFLQSAVERGAAADPSAPDCAVAEAGTLPELLARGGAFASLFRRFVRSEDDEKRAQDNQQALQQDAAAPVPNGAPAPSPVPSPSPAPAGAKGEAGGDGGGGKAKSRHAAGELIEEERREVGGVRADILLAYARACRLPLMGAVMAVVVVQQTAALGVDLWLAHWSAESEDDARAGRGGDDRFPYFLSVYAGLSGAALALILLGSLVAAWAGVAAARKIYDRFIRSVMAAPVSFFDTTPLGRVINRASKDTDTIDKQLPATLYQLATMSLQITGTLLLISVVTVYFAIALVALVALFVGIQRYYAASSRELKRLDSVSRSPIFAKFSETLGGLVTIRAFGAQARFASENEALVDFNTRMFWMSNLINRWLGVRLDVLGALLVFVVALLCVALRDELNPGLAGLVLGASMALTININWLVRNAAMVEMQLNAVERTEEYSRVAPEGGDNRPRPDLPPDWPAQGAIEFREVEARYRDELPLVLRGVSVSIPAGLKVGICGRTGAGKSSLVSLLFRFVECARGSIEIDGVDIRTLSLSQLRSRLAIIPQDPILFKAPVRFNLDPQGAHSDDEVWAALDRARLGDAVRAMPGGLAAEVADGGENFSVGQRQLLCLARAMLRNSRILVLDEATASVDLDTDAAIQRMIREAFAGRTVLTIAHRLATIVDYDRTLVLDAGRVAEFDAPQTLLQREGGAFAELWRSEQRHAKQH